MKALPTSKNLLHLGFSVRRSAFSNLSESSSALLFDKLADCSGILRWSASVICSGQLRAGGTKRPSKAARSIASVSKTSKDSQPPIITLIGISTNSRTLNSQTSSDFTPMFSAPYAVTTKPRSMKHRSPRHTLLNPKPPRPDAVPAVRADSLNPKP